VVDERRIKTAVNDHIRPWYAADMADTEVVPPSQPPKPQWHILRVLVAAIIVVALIAAIGAISYVLFDFTGLVIVAIASFFLFMEVAGQFVGWLLEKLWHKAAPAIPEPVLRRIQFAFTVMVIGGLVLYCAWALNMR